jgi:multidrug resistance efflux pump
MDRYIFKSLDKVEPSKMVRRIWFFSFSTILILVSMLFLPWQQTVKGKGSVVAFDPTERDYSILAPVDGFIERFYVHENQFVKKGEPLFKMVDLDNNYLLKLEKVEKDLKEQIQNRVDEVSNLKQQILETENYLKNGTFVYEQKILQIEEKIASLNFKRVSLQKSYEIEKNNFERVLNLYNEGIESKRQYELVENRYIKAEAELEKIKIDISVEKRNIAISEKEKMKFLNDTKAKLHSLNSNILNVQNGIKQLTVQLQNQLVTIERYRNSEMVAPKDGYVIRLFKNDQNRYIKKGEKILHFAPEVTKRAILLEVSDFNMPLIKEGLPTRIMFHGWPALQISGWPKIQFGSFGGVVEKVEHISHKEGFYYALVTEESDEWPEKEQLRMGSRASVWVRLSTVPIWYQLWRFMNAMPPKMVTPDREKY